MNSLLFILSVLVSMAGLICVYRFFGKYGIYGWIAFACVLANIEVLKIVEAFGLQTTLGNALFGTVFLGTQILAENHGKESAKKAVVFGFIIELAFVVLTQIDIFFTPAETDFANESFITLFRLTPRVCLGSMCAYAVGNFTDLFLFNRFKEEHKEKLLWLRNNVSTLVSQLFDNFIFHVIAFTGVYPFSQIITLSVSVWILEAVVSILDTPFIYLARKLKTEN